MASRSVRGLLSRFVTDRHLSFGCLTQFLVAAHGVVNKHMTIEWQPELTGRTGTLKIVKY
jgi:hypothetical protein